MPTENRTNEQLAEELRVANIAAEFLDRMAANAIDRASELDRENERLQRELETLLTQVHDHYRAALVECEQCGHLASRHSRETNGCDWPTRSGLCACREGGRQARRRLSPARVLHRHRCGAPLVDGGNCRKPVTAYRVKCNLHGASVGADHAN